MNLLNQKQKLFNDQLFEDWSKYMKTVKSKEYRDEVCDFLNNFHDIPIVDDKMARIFIGSFTMMHYDMFDKTDTWDSHLYYATKELHKSFDNSIQNKTEFVKALEKYVNKFKQWKERDEKLLIDKTCTQQYKQIQIMQRQFQEGKTPDEQQLSKSSSMLKRKIETRIKQIGGERAMKYVNDSPKLEPVQVMHLDMEETMKKAFWDMFEDEVNNNQLEPIVTNLKDFRKYFFELIGDSKRAKEIKKRFQDQIDIEILEQMILGGAITIPEIYEIIKTLTWYIKTYVHSASQDKDTEMFLDNVYRKIKEQKEQLGTILRYFFQNIFNKLDDTKIKIQLLTNNSGKN